MAKTRLQWSKPRLTDAVMSGLQHLFRDADAAGYLVHSLGLPPAERSDRNKAIEWIDRMADYRAKLARRPKPQCPSEGP